LEEEHETSKSKELGASYGPDSEEERGKRGGRGDQPRNGCSNEMRVWGGQSRAGEK